MKYLEEYLVSSKPVSDANVTPPFCGTVQLMALIAASQLKALCGSNLEQSRAEIQWWTKNAYNTALKHCSTVHPALLVRMTETCLKFMGEPNDRAMGHRDDIGRRKLNCLFLSVSATIVLARSQESGKEESVSRLVVS